MSKKGNKKSRKQDEKLKKIILLTAILNLIDKLVEIIKKLID